MIINSINKIENTDRDVAWGNGQSRRLLLASDNMGYSLTDTIIDEGTASLLEYRNHLEACYCIEGEGQITDLANDETHDIRPGTIYALNKHDRHVLRANKGTHMRMVCVFNPPLTGREVHDESGAYSLSV